MALVKTSPLVGAISGNIPGANFASTRYGTVARAPKPPPAPPSADQLDVRRGYQVARSWWPQLTDAQRAAWRTYAANRLTTNRIGTQRNLSGQQTFIMRNALEAKYGGSPHTNPRYPDWAEDPSSFTFTVTAGVSAIIHTYPETPIPFVCFVRFSRPFTTHPINHFATWAPIGWFLMDMITEFDCLPEIEARFGTLQPGERVAARIKTRIYFEMAALDWLQTATFVT